MAVAGHGLLLVLLLLAAPRWPAAAGARPLAEDDDDNDACRPHQVHLALTGDPTEMRISWKTRGRGCPSRVSFGPADALAADPPGPLSDHDGSVASYGAHDMCAAPAREFSYEPLYLHSVVLTGLDPGAAYAYKLPHRGDRPSAARQFRAAPRPGPRHGRFRFIMFGDMGDGYHKEAKSPGAADTARAIEEEVRSGAEFVYHVGDLSYANGIPEIWDSFMDQIEPIASRVPYMVAVGNHEYDFDGGRHGGGGADPSGADGPYSPDWGNFGNDSGGECGVATAFRFPMPDSSDLSYWPGAAHGPEGDPAGNPTLGPDAAGRLAALKAAAAAAGPTPEPEPVPGGSSGNSSAGLGGHGRHHRRPNPPFWFSFDYGSVHVVAVSTEHDLRPGSNQYRWLEHDLRGVDRCRTPWVVVGAHRPLYVVHPHKSNRVVAEHLRDQVEGLLSRYEVDIVISGHVHSYSRTCNVLDRRCVRPADGGAVHLTIGCAGRKLSDVAHEQPDWLAHAEVRFGYGRVTVDGGDSMLFEYVSTEDGKVRDSVKLFNSRAGLRGCPSSGSGSGSGDAPGSEEEPRPAGGIALARGGAELAPAVAAA